MAPPIHLYGTWRLASWTIEVMGTGEEFRQFGDDPPGFIHFTPEGRMFAVLTTPGRKPVKTETDQIAAFSSLIAYTGRYRIEGDKLITTVDVSADPAAVGTDLVRFFDLQGDNLEIKTAPFLSTKPSLGLGNKQLQSFLSWKRVGKEN
jgi:Lipocalin-like domain